MSRLVTTLALGGVLSITFALPATAQDGEQRTVPALAAARAGARQTEMEAPRDGARPAPTDDSTAAALALMREAVLVKHRRDQFTTAGTLLGVAAGVIGALRATREEDPLTRGLTRLLAVPLAASAGGAIGAHVGYFVSLRVYPRRSR